MAYGRIEECDRCVNARLTEKVFVLHCVLREEEVEGDEACNEFEDIGYNVFFEGDGSQRELP